MSVSNCVVAEPTPYGKVIAGNVRAARARADISQAACAKRMQRLGFTQVHAQTVGAIERAERRLTAEEIAGLSLVLGTTVAGLVLPPPEVGPFVVFPSGERVPAQRLSIVDDSVTWDGDTIRVTPPAVAYRPIDQRLAAMQDPGERARLAEYAEDLRRQASDQPIVAAITVSPLGVLVGRRNDGKPPWTFIAGEIEPGERAEDAAVREVKEETGLEVAAGQVIGERDHPVTGKHMVYMSATPVRGTDVFVGDEDELAEVRWVSLAEADQLMGGTIYEPVHEYLARELRRQPGGGSGERGDDQR